MKDFDDLCKHNDTVAVNLYITFHNIWADLSDPMSVELGSNDDRLIYTRCIPHIIIYYIGLTMPGAALTCTRSIVQIKLTRLQSRLASAAV